MAANTPRNNQITCIDDIATHDLLDMICWMGVLVGLAPKLVHHTMKAVFFLQIRQNHCMWGKMSSYFVAVVEGRASVHKEKSEE